MKVKTIIFNQHGNEWWGSTPFGIYLISKYHTDSGEVWAFWEPASDIDDDPDAYCTDRKAAMAAVQKDYERRILSALEPPVQAEAAE